MNRFVFIFLNLVLFTSFAKSLELGSPAMNQDGTIRLMTQSDAVAFCLSQNQHLPTVRELAEYAAQLGATGITEINQPRPAGSILISALSAEGKLDRFFYTVFGYQAPLGGTTENLWSSSTDFHLINNGFTLYGAAGTLELTGKVYSAGVRCVLH